jgi:hypothetical protein
MELQDFLNAVRKMREHQKAYFRDRKINDLTSAMHYEKFVDKGLSDGVTVLEADVKPLVVVQAEPVQANLFIGDNNEAK